MERVHLLGRGECPLELARRDRAEGDPLLLQPLIHVGLREESYRKVNVNMLMLMGYVHVIYSC